MTDWLDLACYLLLARLNMNSLNCHPVSFSLLSPAVCRSKEQKKSIHDTMKTVLILIFSCVCVDALGHIELPRIRPSALSQENLADDSLLDLIPQQSITRKRYFEEFLVATAFDLVADSDVLQPHWEQEIRKIKFENDEVVRVLDANTVKLKKTGLVSFAGVHTSSGYKDDFRFPDCMTKPPSSKAKQFLPTGTMVKIKLVEIENISKPRALIVLKSNDKLINAELVREGFARPTISRVRDATERLLPGFGSDLMVLQKEAESDGRGMFKKCEKIETAADDQFEPMELTVETQYGDDGGKQIVRRREKVASKDPPPNPTPQSRAKKLPICADFMTYEDALRWYERYFPFYGDVANLDRNHDGVPCSGLGHTTNQDKYRMKKPNANK